MSSLESCIRKAGKALTKEDANAIRAIRDDILKGKIEPKILVEDESTFDNVNQQAVDEYLDILQGEKNFIMQQIEPLGGTLADKSLSPSEFAKRAGENLEEAARTFPRKGIYRPPTETVVIDYKTGRRQNDDNSPMGRINRRAAAHNMGNMQGNQDPLQRSLDIVTERTNRTVEMLYPDFYTMTPRQVLNIVATFDTKAAVDLAKQYGFVSNKAVSLTNMQDSSSIEVDMQEFYDWTALTIADWITKNETLPLYYKVEDVFERDFVGAHPDHPIAQVTKYGQITQEAEEAAPTGVRKLVNKLKDMGSMSTEAILASVPQTKLKDFVRYGMDELRRYTNTVKRMDAWMNEQMEGDHTLAKLWLKFNRANPKTAKILGEFMHASTLSGVDVQSFRMPDSVTWKKMNKQKRAMWMKRQADYEKLAPFWKKLGSKFGGERVQYQPSRYDAASENTVPIGHPQEVSEAQAIYLNLRDRYANQRDMLVHNLEQRIEQTEADEAAKATLIATLRQQFEAGLITPYFPLSRFGRHQAVAKTTDGEVVAYIKRESKRERNAWIEEMQAKGFIVVPIEEQTSDIEQMNKIDPGFVASVTGLLDEKGVIDADGKVIPGSLVQDQIWQMYLRTLPELSARKAYIHRLGRLGFTHDALRAFSDHSFHGTHQMAKLRYGWELSEHLRNAEEDAVILMQRADKIKGMMDTGWRPKGFEDASIHDVLWDTILGGKGREYRALYSKYKKAANVGSEFHEPSYIKARDQLIKEAEHDGPWAVPLANELKRRHQYNMNPKSGALSTKLTAFGFLWFLSTSPAAGVLNMTQTAISAYPVLRAVFNGQGSGMELLKASKDFATTPWMGLQNDGVNRMAAKLKNDKKSGKELEKIGERAAMLEFISMGIFSKTRTRELMGLSEAGSAYSQRQEQILNYAGYIFHKTEEFNRAVTALAAYRLARKKSSSNKSMSLQDQHDAAVLQAEELVEMSHYDYTNTNRPRPMQGDIGRVVFLFRNYSLNMTYRLMRDFREGIWKNNNIPKEARKEARSRFLGIIGMTTLFAGVGGWPLAWAAESVASNLLGDDDDPFDAGTQSRKLIYDATEKYIAEGWGETVANSVMKGPWAELTGADLSARASLNNLWIREIPQDKWEDPRGLMSHLSGELLGPIWGIAMNAAGGIGDLAEGHPSRGAEKLMPKFISDGLKTIRYATQGAQTYSRDMILSPDQFTTQSLFVQAAGFTPTQLATRYEQNRAIKDMEAKLKNRRSDLLNRLFTAWRLGDRKVATETLKDIAAWNRAQPRYGILSESIMQSARSRSQYDMRTVGGVAVDKRLQYLQNEMRFTDRPK